MKIKFVTSILFFIVAISLSSRAEAYLFGMKARDNTIANIERVEKEYKLDLPIVAFIFDPRGKHVENMMNQLNEKLGEDKVYHISLSPDMYTAKQVAEGKFDTQYTQFFKDIKKNNLRIIFRTMHEMNG